MVVRSFEAVGVAALTVPVTVSTFVLLKVIPVGIPDADQFTPKLKLEPQGDHIPDLFRPSENTTPPHQLHSTLIAAKSLTPGLNPGLFTCKAFHGLFVPIPTLSAK